MVIVGLVHSVQLGQGPEPRAPVVQEVVLQVRSGGGALQGAEAPGQRLGALVAVDVQGVEREAVPVVVRVAFLHLDHRGHVALAGGGVGGGLLHHGVEGGVGEAVGAAEQGAVLAGGAEDRHVVAEREENLK